MAVLSVGCALIIAGNLFLNPLNPVAATIVPRFGEPFPPTFGIDWAPLPDTQSLQTLISVIPQNAIVAAPLPVYSLVADDPYAYPLIHFNSPPLYNDSLLPDNESARVQYVLLPYNMPAIYMPVALSNTLYDRSLFGVRGCVASSPVGGVELFQRGYSGTPEVFGPTAPLCPNYFAGGAGLTPAKYASTVVNASSPAGVMVVTKPCHGIQPIWTGPGISLPAGDYSVHLVVAGYNATSAVCATKNVSATRQLIRLNLTGEEGGKGTQTLHLWNLTQGQVCSLGCGNFTFGNWTFDLTTSYTDLSLSGELLVAEYVIELAYILILPSDS